MKKFSKKDGFTLIEMILVIAAIGIISVIGLPAYFGYSEDVARKTDLSNLAVLNQITPLYRVEKSFDDPFENRSNDNSFLLNVLIEEGFLSLPVEPKIKNTQFAWDFDKQVWVLERVDSEAEPGADKNPAVPMTGY